MGVIPGWYGNNCHCKDLECKDEKCFAGDVQATLDYGFSSIKLDGCGVEKNVTLYAELFNKTGKHVMIENCHNGNPTYPTRKDDGTVDCPMVSGICMCGLWIYWSHTSLIHLSSSLLNLSSFLIISHHLCYALPPRTFSGPPRTSARPLARSSSTFSLPLLSTART